jgi:hypothetical protein
MLAKKFKNSVPWIANKKFTGRSGMHYISGGNYNIDSFPGSCMNTPGRRFTTSLRSDW